MQFIQYFFTLNHDIIYFIYGLVFFVLGLAIALQSRHSSRLDLARNLTWLAAFGFLHGFNEWGNLFIPLQAEYLSQTFILVLQYIHLFLLAASFACLFEFGVALMAPSQARKWLHILPAGILAVWAVFIFIPMRLWNPDINTWQEAANALARYFIGLPAGLLAAYALRTQTLRRIASFKVPQIERALQAASVSLAIYALAAGLIVPPVGFFPGNVLNSDVFSRILVVPIQLFRALIGLAMAWTTIRVLEIFDVEITRQIEQMTQQQILATERERIGRELHDGTIQKVYTAGLLVRSAQNLAVAESPLAGRLATAVGVLDDAIGDLRQNLGLLQSSPQMNEPLEVLLKKLVSDPRFNSLVDIALELDLADGETLPPERIVHVLAILQEAFTNIIRHAKARHIRLTARRLGEILQLVVQDDGIGIPADGSEGHGMQNMRERAALLHGRLKFKPSEKGTSITLDIPWSMSA